MARIYLLITICLLTNLTIIAQKHLINYQTGIRTETAAKPFWLHTNTKNKIASNTYVWENISLFTDFAKQNTQAFNYSFGFEGMGTFGQYHNRIFINQLFGKIRWQNLTCNVGQLDNPSLYDGLSTSNGTILYSNNSHNMADHYAKNIRMRNKMLPEKFSIISQLSIKCGAEDNTQWKKKILLKNIKTKRTNSYTLQRISITQLLINLQ